MFSNTILGDILFFICMFAGMKKMRRMNIRHYMMIFALGSALTAQAQKEPAAPVFRPPFDFPLSLSGNFGELRSNHFHGGVDFKTQGEVGKPIHCIADGYVSRVLITPGGYGQAIYITHPNGYTSVYGHVLKFAPAVAKVWRNISMSMKLIRWI